MGVSEREKAERIAQQLISSRDFSPDEINILIKNEFNDDFFKRKRQIGKYGITYSFKTDTPFVSAGNFFKNIIKVYPDFYYQIESSKALFFKNMIIHKGQSKIRINNFDEYQKIQNEFSKNFDISAPTLEIIFNALISDESSIQKIIDDEICLEQIKKIFSHLENSEWLMKLHSAMIIKYNERIEDCQIRKRFEVDQEKIENIDKGIEKYQEIIIKIQRTEKQ